VSVLVCLKNRFQQVFLFHIYIYIYIYMIIKHICLPLRYSSVIVSSRACNLGEENFARKNEHPAGYKEGFSVDVLHRKERHIPLTSFVSLRCLSVILPQCLASFTCTVSNWDYALVIVCEYKAREWRREMVREIPTQTNETYTISRTW
jgi:hypothetical protein